MSASYMTTAHAHIPVQGLVMRLLCRLRLHHKPWKILGKYENNITTLIFPIESAFFVVAGTELIEARKISE